MTGLEDFKAIYAEAHKAGMAAGDAETPTPMLVEQHENPLDDESPLQKVWKVPQGVCGFAWIIVRPGNCGFARWCRKNKGTGKAYYGGEQIWVGEFGQSYDKKMAYASAFASVLRHHDINAHSFGRFD